MKRIRTKILFLFLGLVLLPLLPTAWLVNQLVRQSYQIGVNPQVEEALKQGVAYSRELYQIRKTRLRQALSQLLASPGLSGDSLADIVLPADTPTWQFLALELYDDRGRLLDQLSRPGGNSPPLSPIDFSQLPEKSPDPLVLSDRRANRFTAVRAVAPEGQQRFVALRGAFRDRLLENSDHSLQVYQLYRTLALSPAAIPRSFLNAFLVLYGLILLITVAIALRVSRRFTQPLDELVKGTQEVGRGNLEYRLELDRRDEIGELGTHFNRMAGELKSFQERTIYLEKMAAWQEIARRLAHEIKNPLTPIQLTVQEMIDQYQGEDAEYRRLLQECHAIINEEIDNLRRLVQEFSDFGRLPELSLQEGDIHALIQDVRRLYPHQEIELLLAEDVPPLVMDEDRLRRVLINLIENAIQAAPPQEQIIVQTHLNNDQVEISVRDRGFGIPEHLRETIFQPYYSTKSNGVGLGLAITRKMVEEHQGRIRVSSTVGEGSTFIVTLPTTLNQTSQSHE